MIIRGRHQEEGLQQEQGREGRHRGTGHRPEEGLIREDRLQGRTGETRGQTADIVGPGGHRQGHTGGTPRGLGTQDLLAEMTDHRGARVTTAQGPCHHQP